MVTCEGMARASSRTAPVASAESPVDPRKLGARAHAELREHLAQVVLDGARAEEQPAGDVAVRRALGGEARDLQLLRCEVVDRAGVALAGGLAGGAQLLRGACLPARGAELAEAVE